MTWISNYLKGWEGTWFGPEQAQPAGTMTLHVYAGGSLAASMRGRGFVTFTAAGASSFTAPATGRGLITCAMAGASTMTATMTGTPVGPTFGDMTVQMYGAGALAVRNAKIQAGMIEYWIEERKPEPQFADMKFVARGSGALGADIVAAGIVQADMRMGARGSGSLDARMVARWSPSETEMATAILLLARSAA